MSDHVMDEIQELRLQVASIEERIANLRKLRSRPYVQPVLVYWRYRHEYREPYDVWPQDERSPLEAAYVSLEYMAEEGECAADGVEVDGRLYKMGDLREMFGRYDEDD